jgi:UDP-N-acetylmuramoyl-tripeptide--D-alanyl-D-alanine ligase
MDRLSLQDLATATGGRLESANPRAACARISTDSREIQPGDVFWALSGERFDGHDFIDDALKRGAQLAVCRRDRAARRAFPRLIVDDTLAALGRLAHWCRGRQEALVVAVTGSVGKTTTKDLIHAALGRQFHGMCSPGNFNNAVGLPKSLLAIERAHEYAILELGASREGEIRELAALAAPEIGAITAIGKSHLASFGSLEAIVRAKGELLEALPSGGFAILPGDDPVTAALASRAACRVVLVGERPHNDVRAEGVACTGRELSFFVGADRFTIPFAGRHLLTNALIAVAIAREIGVSSEMIAAGLREFVPAKGRCHWLACGPWTVIDDTYNANPLSVRAACRYLAAAPGLTRSRRYLVLGDMLELGSEAAAEHVAIGRDAASLPIDGVLALGDFAADVARGANLGGMRIGRIVASRQLEVLLTVLDCWLEPGDIVLVKGSRGMAMERVVEWLQHSAQQAVAHPPRRCA